MPSRGTTYILALVLLTTIGLLLRTYGLEHGLGFHPDERGLVMTIQKLTFADLNPNFFAYGSFPIYLLWIIGKALGAVDAFWSGYDGLFYVGRFASALFGSLTIPLTFVLARTLHVSVGGAIFSAGLLAFNLFHLQNSHFATVDVLLTLIMNAALLCLLKFAHTVQTGGQLRSDWFVLACLAIALGLATKVTAISLLIPWAGIIIYVALKARHQRKNPWIYGGTFALSGLTIIFAFFYATQPHAILDAENYWKQLFYQINMVRGLENPPYVLQFTQTKPLLYHIQQMFHYTMGPPIFIVLALSVIYAVVKAVRHKNLLLTLALSWFCICTFSVSMQYVKFPRYMLPFYPLMFVFAGMLFADLVEKFRRWVICQRLLQSGAFLLVIYSFALSFGMLSVWGKPHIWTRASEWMYQNIPAGNMIIGEHWDDQLPLSLPGFDHARFSRPDHSARQLPLYEPEQPDKWQKVVDALTEAQVITLTTPRLYGSITQAAERYPQTVRYYQRLFSGELGFKIAAIFKEYPRFGPWYLDDDLADESFSVYDHPRVVILVKEKSLTKNELLSLVDLPAHAPTDLSAFRRTIMTLPPTESPNGAPIGLSKFLSVSCSVVGWYLWLTIMGLVAWVALFNVWHARFADHGYGFTKALGFFAMGYLSWLASQYGWLAATASNNVILIIVVALAVLVIFRNNVRRIIYDWSSLKSRLLHVEILCLVLFALGILIRSFNPDIYWGEKPMDSGFLRYLTRYRSGPVSDVWAAGHPTIYYYFGFYLFGMLSKITGLSGDYGFNVAISTVYMLFAAASWSLAGVLRLGPTLQTAATMVLVCASNAAGIGSFLEDGRRGFHLFWASSRTMPHSVANEYPYWSFLFADLHAHYMALPLAMVFLGLLVQLTGYRQDARGFKQQAWTFMLCGFVLGMMMLTNSWDFIACGFVLGVAVLLQFRPPKAEPVLKQMQRAALSCGSILCAMLLASPFVAQMLQSKHGPTPKGIEPANFNALAHVLHAQSMWLIPVLIGLLVLAGQRSWKSLLAIALDWRLAVRIAAGLLPILFMACLHRYLGGQNLPWDIIGFSVFFIGLLMCAENQFSDPLIKAFCELTLLIYFWGIIATELFWINDHLNTYFKFYYIFNHLLAVAAIMLIWEVWQIHADQSQKTKTKKKAALPSSTPAQIWHKAAFAACLTVVLCSLLISVLHTILITNFNRTGSLRPDLSGTGYLMQTAKDDQVIIDALQKNITGVVNIVEAHGPPYQEFSRISMHTGLPNLLGWSYHVRQRGLPDEQILAREQAIQQIYTHPNLSTVISYLDFYRINLVMVGELEIKTYGINPDHNVFTDHPHLFTPIFTSGRSRLYARNN